MESSQTTKETQEELFKRATLRFARELAGEGYGFLNDDDDDDDDGGGDDDDADDDDDDGGDADADDDDDDEGNGDNDDNYRVDDGYGVAKGANLRFGICFI